MVESRVPRDSEKPGGKLVLLIECRELAESLLEALHADILDFFSFLDVLCYMSGHRLVVPGIDGEVGRLGLRVAAFKCQSDETVVVNVSELQASFSHNCILL